MRREYKTGSKYALWMWKDIYWRGELYLRRLILVQCPLFSIMLHWIKQPDKQRHLHDHPVSMLSILLKGEYLEATDYCFLGNGNIWPDKYKHAKWFNWIPATKKHRITHIPDSGCITLCIAGPRTREWGFYTEEGWIQWQKYHELYDSSTS